MGTTRLVLRAGPKEEEVNGDVVSDRFTIPSAPADNC